MSQGSFLERGASASFDATRTYRYTLGRRIADAGGRILWCMLNPSTADENVLDPTIRRCIGFSRGWGFGDLVVVNLFALRSTDPKALIGYPDPVGPANDAAIASEAARADCIMVAWGAHPMAAARARAVVPLFGSAMHSLGVTAAGAPRHPLYVAGAQPRLPFLVAA